MGIAIDNFKLIFVILFYFFIFFMTAVNREDFPAFGFVKVGEDKIDGEYGIYKRYSASFDPSTQGVEVLFGLYKTLAKEVFTLEEVLKSIKRQYLLQDSWNRRYPKRLAIGGNIVLALWIFSFHFLKSVRGSGKVRSKILELLKVSFIGNFGEGLFILFIFRILFMVNKK